MRILICGSRYWNNINAIRRELSKYTAPNTIVISGGCRGADVIGETVALELDMTVWVFLPDWNIGRAAGPIRNKRMLVEGKPDLVLAFHEDFNKSRGTKDMITQAKRANVPHQIFEN